jgi:hypothetical protein
MKLRALLLLLVCGSASAQDSFDQHGVDSVATSDEYNFDHCVSSLYQKGGLSQYSARQLCFKDRPTEQVLDCQRKRFFFDYLEPRQAYEACLKNSHGADRYATHSLPGGAFENLPQSAADKKTVCTITVNSDDEKKMFKEVYSGAEYRHVELLPRAHDANSFYARDNRWLKRACESKVSCDILVISGHFAGQFFGSTGFSVDAQDLWKQACTESCGGVFKNVKEVFLFGCNTLASKVPDKRSPEQYIQILTEDGLDPGTAQRIAAQRYTEYGLTFKQRMQWMFPHAQAIYGYPAGGPQGYKVAPSLRKFLKGASFESSLAKTGMQKVKGEDSLERGQFCSAVEKQSQAPKDTFMNLSAAEDLRLSQKDLSVDPKAFGDHVRRFLKTKGQQFPVVGWDLIEISERFSVMDSVEAKKLRRSLVEPIAKQGGLSARKKLCPILLQSKDAMNLDLYYDVKQCELTDWL